MARSRKKASNPPKDVSPSTTKIEDNQFESILFEASRFNGNFNIWEAKMRTFLQSQGIELLEPVIDDSTMDRESEEYNAKATKTILNGLHDSVKKNLGKHSSAKDIWDKLHDLHSKGALTMTINQKGDPKPIIEAKNENEDIKAEADLEDEKNEKDFVEELLAQFMAAMEEINNLKKENEALKKIAPIGNQDQTRKKVDLIKLQVQERDEELAKLNKEFHQSKRKHHEEVISMTNQLNKAKKQENTLSSQLEQRHKSVNKLEEEIGQYKVEVSSLKSQLQEAKKQAQGAEKKLERSQAKNEEIFKMKSDIISLNSSS